MKLDASAYKTCIRVIPEFLGALKIRYTLVKAFYIEYSDMETKETNQQNKQY